MGLFRKKPVEVEAITFEEFIVYGLKHSKNIVEGMPWSFEYKGHPVTHENNERYLIPTLEGTHNLTPNDMLITGVNGEIYPCRKDIFEKTYERVPFADCSNCGWSKTTEEGELYCSQLKEVVHDDDYCSEYC